MSIKFRETVEKIVEKNPEYPPDAYEFINLAVSYTSEKLGRYREKDAGKRHMSAEELLEGIVEYALREFGPMAEAVMKSWNLDSPGAIGKIVFYMIEGKLLRASENDTISDFELDYDIDRALCRPFAGDAGHGKSITPPRIA
jgi:uncharacterized repeat protein (TIGR04138 family)